MVRLPTRVLARLLASTMSNRYLSCRTHQVLSLLEPYHRSSPAQLSSFFSTETEKIPATITTTEDEPMTSDSDLFDFSYVPEEIPEDKYSPKAYGVRDIAHPVRFQSGDTTFIFNVSEFTNGCKKIVMIVEYLKEMKHTRQVWLSLPAAKMLAERLSNHTFEVRGKNSKKSKKQEPIMQFIDGERKRSVELRQGRHLDGIPFVKIESIDLVAAKGQSVIIPLDSISTFIDKLAAVLKNYENLRSPNRAKVFDIVGRTRSFEHGPKRYHMNLIKTTSDSRIMLTLLDFNPKENKKRFMFICIDAVQSLLDTLQEADELILKYEGVMPKEKKPTDILFEKTFTGKDKEYTVDVSVSEPEMIQYGDMALRIKTRELDRDLRNVFIIRSLGVLSLLRCLEALIIDYERLKISKITVEQRKELFEQENSAWDADLKAEVANLKNSDCSEREFQKEIIKIDEKYAKKMKKIEAKFMHEIDGTLE